CNLAPTRVTSNVKFQSIAAGDAFTCALSTTGQIFCWGAGASGQLGDGQGLARGTPAPVVSDLKFRSLTAGAQHACAITDRGAGYCWGGNARGQLGNGSMQNGLIPSRVMEHQ